MLAHTKFRKLMITTRPLHLLLDCVLLELPELSIASLEVIIKLFRSIKTGVCIPEKTLLKKMRVVIVQHGVVLVLLHVLIHSKQDSLRLKVNQYIRNGFTLKELEWNLKMVHEDFLANIILESKESDGGVESEERKRKLPQIEQLKIDKVKAEYFTIKPADKLFSKQSRTEDIYQGKHFILSK